MKTEKSAFFNYFFFIFSYESKLLEIYKHGLLIVLSLMSRMNDGNGFFGPNDLPKKNFLLCLFTVVNIFKNVEEMELHTLLLVM